MYLVDNSIPDYNANVFILQIYRHNIKRLFPKAILILFVRYENLKAVTKKSEIEANGRLFY